jgi:hypothetical protein
LPEAIVPDFLHGEEIGFGDLRAHISAERAIHRFPDGIVIREGKAHAVDRRRGHESRQNETRQREEFDSTGAYLAERIGVGTQLARRKNLQIETAVRLLLDRSRHFSCPDIHRMRLGQVVGVFVSPLRLLCARDEGRANGSCANRRTGGGQQTAAR